jgi:uncharacterized repeat protein (TIGR02543 family)
MKAQKLFGYRLITLNNWSLTNMVSGIVTLLLFNLFWITTSLAAVNIPDEVLEEIHQNDSARILLRLSIPWKPEGKPQTAAAAASVKKQRDNIKSAQNTFKSRLTQVTQSTSTPRGKNLNPNIKEFQTIPYLGMEVDSSVLSALQKIPGIKEIALDSPDEILLTDSVPLIGASAAWQSGYTGEGQTVVILDTGIDKTHPLLAGKVMKELCFSTQCPNGSTTQQGDGSAIPCPFSSYCDHGTHVAGIVTGVATGSKLIAAQVFSNYYSMPASYVSDQIAALEWVYLNYNSVSPPIAAINMSLGGGQYTAPCDTDSRAAIINNLKSVGIATVVASGNSGYTNSLSAPACISSVVSVGATDNSDNIAYFSNSASFLDVLAPGVDIESTIPGGGMGLKSGTSMAAPHIAGAWAILKSMFLTATVDSLLTDIKNKGVPITDTRNNITTSRINLAPFLQSQQYTLTLNPPSNGKVSSSDGKIDCGGTCGANYSSGQVVTLQAVANPGFQFTQWGGDCGGITNSMTMTITAAKTCTATFAPLYSLTITLPSNGKVTSQDGYLNCGSSCSKQYIGGQLVTLQAIANTGKIFTQWGGDCSGTTNPLTVTMDANKTCTATFVSLYSLTITSPSNGKVTSQDGNIDCGSQCSKGYPSGQTVTLTTQANPGYQFTKWGGSCSGTTNPLTVTMSAAKSCTATIVPTYALTINPSTNGKVTTSDGKVDCGSSCTSTYPSGQAVTLKTTANSGYQFTQWGGDCSGTTSSITVTMTAAKTCTATFTTIYPLTITSHTNGTVTTPDGYLNCGSLCSKQYIGGQSVTLQAIANTGKLFTQWGGDCSGATNPLTVTMDAAKTCTATFTPLYSLTITSPSNGKVTSQDGNFDCGSQCSNIYLSGQTVTLTAQADPGYLFTKWGGNCSGTTNPLIVTMSAAKSCTATIVPTYALTIASPTNGKVTTSDGKIACGSSCTNTYPSGQVVTLKAAAASSVYQFTQWGGDCSGTTNSITVTIDSAKTCIATFPIADTLLTVSKVGGSASGIIQAAVGGTVNLTCGTTCTTTNKKYAAGSPVTLTATASTGYQFMGWGGACSGTASPITVTMDSANTCTATFNLASP